MSIIKRHRNRNFAKKRGAHLALALLLALSIFTVGPNIGATGSGSPVTSADLDLTGGRVRDFDVNLAQFVNNLPGASQLAALENLKLSLGDTDITALWDKKTGSVDTIYDFASAPSSLDPEAAARAFIQGNAALLGVTDMSALRLKSNVAALGGNLLYFQQTHNGLPVVNGGIGVMMDGERRVKMVSGPYHSTLSVPGTPSLDAAAAVAAAQADLAPHSVAWAAGVADVLNPALDLLAAKLGPFATPQPELNVYPTPGGARLAWKLYYFSRNPFGVFRYQIDALTGAVLYREDCVRYQQEPLPFTADFYPTYPAITQELKDQGIISVDASGKPLGQLRIQLRNFDPSNAVTGVNGTLTGTHAHIENALALKLPFAQAAQGTWHFRNNNLPLEGRTNEREHYGPTAEPAEHQDEISQFIYINSVIEYIDYLHRAGDAAHSRFGQGDFPDTYPNQATPLVGIVHIPNVLAPPTNPQDPEFLPKLLGLDNAFALPLSEEIAGQKVVVNPTAYGHGYLLNDLAIDFSVPYHEGMHSISSPIAGLEGTPEGPALNEGQADLWAYSAGENPVLGAYPVNAFKLRQLIRDSGGNPDLRGWIRHADSGLVYSQLGTYQGGSFEEHRDGEIFAAAMWDIRELMLMYQTGGPYKRPNLVTGQASDQIQLGKETWERIFLGAIYVLGTFNPDTFVRARTAMILADQSLYPANPVDPDSPGLHRALIEQAFAAREIGINAEAPNGGKQTISTQVSQFAASQPGLARPAGVTVLPASPSSARVSWQAVNGALAYEVLRREIGKENQRQNPPVPGREYVDGDGATNGYMHIAYVPASQTSYVDNGLISGGSLPRGLKNPAASEYVVRTLNINANRQLGVSVNSAAASVPTAVLDVTKKVQATISNVSFTGGKFEFDQIIRNLGGVGAGDGTLYTPIEFRIVRISNPTVSVANADNGGAGRGNSPAIFYYRPVLATGQSSEARHLIFNNPNAQLFTFDAVVKARVQVAPNKATRYQPEPPPDLSKFTRAQFTETFTGTVLASDTGLQLLGGVTYVDVPFTSKTGAFAVTGAMTSTLGVDLDLQLRDAAGNVIASGTTASANETVTAAIQPNKNYFYRIIGWAGAAQDYSLVSTQELLIPNGSDGGGGDTPLPTLTGLFRFTVNPLTGTVTIELLQ